MAIEGFVKVAKEIGEVALKEVGKKISQEGLGPKTFDRELGKNIVESLKDKFLDTNNEELGGDIEKGDITEVKDKLENIENKIDFEPEKIIENPEAIVKEFSEVGEILNEFKDEIEIFRECVDQLKELQNDVRELIGEDNYNMLSSSILEKLMDGTSGSDVDEQDEDYSE
ncbi:hypothetical protein [Belliella aquatica]|uniref:Uncharacterized protein n=1 Tax=Belliella aquatica TaxID=1323734 RepID=A0ABQ1MWK4_9BACT|nr:hypothetical protein [Belliella aquatica]MCH7406596.1 hypothetical protein [Belliella aquatica]GGC48206.1 hypothetical protein GCM10010993_28390 [Belliella aquatica]